MIYWMLRCKSTSSSEHQESSKEASEAIDSVTEASELSRTKRSLSVPVGSMWVRGGTVSDISLPLNEGDGEKGRVGGACEEQGWVWY